MVYKCDIKKFYDSLDHKRLLRKVEERIEEGRALDLVRTAIKMPTVPRGTKRREYGRFAQRKGVPQGLAISNILAAIYVAEVDAAMVKMPVKYYRYVDDIFVLGSTDFVKRAQKSLVQRLRIRKLAVHPIGSGKSQLVSLKESFGYLGYQFRLPLVTVRESTVDRFLQSIAAKFSEYKHNKKRRLERHKYLDENRLKEIFLLELNERIAGAISENKKYGWIAYFSEINDLSLLSRLDASIRRFFGRLSDFENKPPEGLKRLSRAFFEMKYRPTARYIRNYDLIATRPEKLEFLQERGRVGPEEYLTDEQIDGRYEAYRRHILSRLTPDDAMIY
jgi:hypothetical protein